MERLFRRELKTLEHELERLCFSDELSQTLRASKGWNHAEAATESATSYFNTDKPVPWPPAEVLKIA